MQGPVASAKSPLVIAYRTPNETGRRRTFLQQPGRWYVRRLPAKTTMLASSYRGSTMADAIWYYAKHDQQHGPVSAAQLQELVTGGTLLPTDLVWKEGMDDWAPASEVKGLFASAVRQLSTAKPAGTGEPVAPSDAVTTSPAESPPAKPASTASLSGSASRWANMPPASPSASNTFTPPEPPPAVVRSATAATNPSRRNTRAATPASPLVLPAWLGPALLIVGLLLVLGIRGCDSLGERYAARAVARAAVSKDRFEDTWTAKRYELEAERARLQATKDDGLRKEADLEAIDERLQTLGSDQKKERTRLERERWRELDIAARDAKADNTMWAYWRQLCFLPATLVFVTGLLMVATTHEGPQRWICLIVLAIVAYSLFVGGAAWM